MIIMKKTMITLSFCSLLCLSGCDKPNSPLIQDHTKTNDHLSKPQNQQIPDWTGHYKGFIPCKACEKKLFSIQLHPNQTYTLKEIQFFKQKTRQKQSSGTFSFDPQNSRLIQLTENKSNKIRYLSWHDQFLELRDQVRNLSVRRHWYVRRVWQLRRSMNDRCYFHRPHKQLWNL